MIAGKGLTKLGKWMADRHTAYIKFIRRVQRMIAAVTKAEKEERMKARAIQKAIRGYDPTKWMETYAKIRDVDQNQTSFIHISLPPPIIGKHKYSKWKQQYHDIHAFLTAREWAPTVPDNGKGGVTWLELFTLFDTTKARNKQGHHHKDEEALKRARARSSKLKKTKTERDRRTAEIRPTLNEELGRFKAIARYILRHDANEQQASWFSMEARAQHKRLTDLGVYGHQPAVAAYVKMSEEEKTMITDAILQQKIGANPKSQKEYKELRTRQKAGESEEKIKVKIDRIAFGSMVKWKRTTNNEEEATINKEDEERKIPKYSSRMIACNKCGKAQETKAIQLRTLEGYRGLYCSTCGTQDRCALNKCQCHTIWHQCEIHRTDPPTHASRKGIVRNKSGMKEVKEKIMLCSQRKAPRTKAKGNLMKCISKKMKRMPRHIARKDKTYIHFVVSTNPPKAELIEKIGQKTIERARSAEHRRDLLNNIKCDEKYSIQKSKRLEVGRFENLDREDNKKPEEYMSKQPTTRDELKRRLNANILNQRIRKEGMDDNKWTLGSKVGKSEIKVIRTQANLAGTRPRLSSSTSTSDAIARLLSVS